MKKHFIAFIAGFIVFACKPRVEDSALAADNLGITQPAFEGEWSVGEKRLTLGRAGYGVPNPPGSTINIHHVDEPNHPDFDTLLIDLHNGKKVYVTYRDAYNMYLSTGQTPLDGWHLRRNLYSGNPELEYLAESASQEIWIFNLSR